ncbi:nuclear transport factor 2 family protein [Mangrovimicrobium sediminis]|uniref:Nuclear transport factor 2 family protein n=1 Tax=Mangrovimicrobium sediminis TaxID=2562682 RepID=A0A4Z0M1B1_9GAMM|nr:nuclear transport factor 2 family protein [Haliea sp. SAOS-164]TGD73309.1 nuclear transport factor 2 family protein [Haliea sp. SAOS-164]
MSDGKAVVQGLINSVLAGDLEGMFSHLAEDLVVDEPLSLAIGGVHRGKQEFLKGVIEGITAKADMRIHDYRVISESDQVVVNMTLEFIGHSNGATLEMPYVELYTVSDGLISRIDVYPKDTKALCAFWDTI